MSDGLVRLGIGTRFVYDGELAEVTEMHAAAAGDFATKGWESGEIRWSTGQHWPSYDAERRASRVILSARDLMVDDPDAESHAACAGLH
jgi:hypothetical protein